MSPTQRSLKALRAEGWTVDVVERWLPGINRRKDLFDCYDLLAIKKNHRPLLVQVTSTGVASRVKKVCEHELHQLVSSIFAIEVHGWRKNSKGRIVQRVVTIS